MKTTLFTLAVICFASNCSNSSDGKRHSSEKTEKLYSIRLDNNGIVSYQHLVLMPGLNKDADSASILEPINKYIANLGSDKPVSSVEVFNSKKNFNLGEVSQRREAYGDCVVTIWFDLNTGKPVDFLFYDYSGNIIYHGPLWNQK